MYHVAQNVAVVREREVCLAKTSLTGDDNMISLCVAPILNENSWAIYLQTNGDPVYLGCCANDGIVWVNDEPCNSDDPYCDEETWSWGLGIFGFQGHSEEQAFLFLQSYTPEGFPFE